MSLNQYLAEIKRIRILEYAEERALWQDYKECGDINARQKLIEHYQPLVFKVAMRWSLPETVMLDIVQEGTVGLIEAVENFDHKKGVAFSLYAMHRIKGRIINYMEREGKLKWTYLDSPAIEGDDSSITFADYLVDPAAGIQDQAEQNFLVEQIKTAIDRLPVKEQLVLNGVYLDEQEPKQIAQTLDLSISHVYRLQKQGIRRLRGMLSKLMHELKV